VDAPKYDFVDFAKSQSESHWPNGLFLPPGLDIGGVFDKDGDDDGWGSATTTTSGDANFDLSSSPSTGSEVGQPAYVNIGLLSLGHKSLQDTLALNDYADVQGYTSGKNKHYEIAMLPDLFGPCGDDHSTDYMNSLVGSDITDANWMMSYDTAMTQGTTDSAVTHQFID
jgi:hypothetical protein